MGRVGNAVDDAGEDETLANGTGNGKGVETIGASDALDRLKESEATEWLAPPPALVQCVKQASEVLFSLTADNFEKAPLSKLYTDDRFDVEQIWQQIDLQSHPILSYIRRKFRNLEKCGRDEFFTGLGEEEEEGFENGDVRREDIVDRQSGSENEDESEEFSDDQETENPEEESDSGEEGGDDEEEKGGKNGVEDEFFRISEMEKFLDRTDAEGVFGTGEEEGPRSSSRNDDDGEDDDDEEEDDEDGETFGAGTSEGEEDEDGGLGFGKYKDFFANVKKGRKSKKVQDDLGHGQESGDEPSEDHETDDKGTAGTQVESKSSEVEKLSAHERRQEKIQKRMHQLEKASLDPKDWTQQGEVTAKRRPKNSALEVELDFEHNVRPPPIITEEVTASLEDMIKARIAEGRFDDVQRKVVAPVTAPKERIELDESKSKKGLGEIYEAEYMEKTGLAAAPTSTSEALRVEAKDLFKALCNKLDALSHFHFAPKPVIQDMEVHANVPALAMEEVAPLAVSEASMLAPEEIFAGESAIKGEGELTPEERKRRRAQKKRKRKGAKKAQEVERLRKRLRPTGLAPVEPKVTPGLKVGHSSFSKSSKVFAELDRAKDGIGKPPPKKKDGKVEQALPAPFLKL